MMAGEFVLTWVIEGAKKAYESNFKLRNPSIVQEAINNYKKQNDWFGIFINECCEVNKDFKCSSFRLYQTYREFSLARGERPRATIDFYSELERQGYKRIELKNELNKRELTVLGLGIKNIDIIADFDFLN